MKEKLTFLSPSPARHEEIITGLLLYPEPQAITASSRYYHWRTCDPARFKSTGTIPISIA
jgi:hypothetical protein